MHQLRRLWQGQFSPMITYVSLCIGGSICWGALTMLIILAAHEPRTPEYGAVGYIAMYWAAVTMLLHYVASTIALWKSTVRILSMWKRRTIRAGIVFSALIALLWLTFLIPILTQQLFTSAT